MKKKQSKLPSITVTGQIFSSDMLPSLVQGNGKYQSPEDYKLLPGIRFSDEISRSMHIGQALYAEFKKKQTDGASLHNITNDFITKLFTLSLNYTELKKADEKQKLVEGTLYSIPYFAAPSVPLVICPGNLKLDQTDTLFTTTKEGVTRKKSAFSLAQLYVNASKECSWAIVTNGKEIRLLHDSDSMVRPQYVSCDIETIFEEQQYPDYLALWYMLHASRALIWEQWRIEGLSQGTRVRDGLRAGVTDALLHLGAGFLQTKGKGNEALRKALQTGKTEEGESYTLHLFYQEMLRLIYRFLFLSTLEERNLLFVHTENETDLPKDIQLAQTIYTEGYSIHRLAVRAKKNTNNDRYTDLWQGVKIVFKSLQCGNPQLDLTALGGLFKLDQCPMLDQCELDNTHLLKTVRKLRWCYIDDVFTFTDYRNMDTEEFGSVYESLLELVPRVDLDSGSFSFVGIGDERGVDEEGKTTGNERKLTGSYYTSSELVQCLIESALIPAIEKKVEKEKQISLQIKEPFNEEKALLSMTVIDPACGSGHFLLSAARCIAQRLAEVRQEKNPDEVKGELHYRHALRDVIASCVYGVDLNPMAVELARTALWLEGYEPGKPLGFLDHHIKCGNSLTGVFDMGVLENGIPDAAYSVLSGDDKKTCSVLKTLNRDSKLEKVTDNFEFDFGHNTMDSLDEYSKLIVRLGFMSNETIEEVEAKEKRYHELLKSKDYLKRKTACDLYTASFFAQKNENTKSIVPLSTDIRAALQEESEPYGKEGTRSFAVQIAQENRFFHWPLEFPEIFQKNLGFDCVLGNPPWDVSQLKEEEFFSQYNEGIAILKGAERKKAIENLKTEDPNLYEIYEKGKNANEVANIFYQGSSRFILTAHGKINLYALFAELVFNLRSAHGTAGFIVPSGIATDDGTKFYFEKIATGGMLKSLYDFENREKLFPTVDSRFKFCLITLAPKLELSDFSFFLLNTKDLDDQRRHFTMRAEDFDLINPNTHTCPVFRSKKDAELTKQMYKRAGVFIKEKDSINGNPWNVRFRQGIYNMTSASNLFHTKPGKDETGSALLPLYEAKMMHQFDHRWNTFTSAGTVESVTSTQKRDPAYTVTPQYWVSRAETVLRTTTIDEKVVSALRSALCSAKGSSEYSALQEACYKTNDPNVKKVFDSCSQAGTDADLVKMLYALAEEHAPKYLMGWRGITNATNERTVISTIVPICGVGHSANLYYSTKGLCLDACLLANFNSIVLDYQARQKVGGVNLTQGYIKQFPVLPPSTYTPKDLSFIVPRVFALTYTAYDMSAWAEALWNESSLEMRIRLLHAAVEDSRSIQDEKFVDRAFSSSFIPPIEFDVDKRAVLQSELDAYYARLYGLSRSDLQYILDPSSIMEEGYPSLTFPGLKNSEIKEYGEYKTQRLVLEAWDKLDRGEIDA